jgi:hypothetical protein
MCQAQMLLFREWRRSVRRQTAFVTVSLRYAPTANVVPGFCRSCSPVRVRLIRKLAALIDGVDLSRHSVGEVIELPQREAQLLIAEGWAMPMKSLADSAALRETAADAPPSSRRKRRRRRQP